MLPNTYVGGGDGETGGAVKTLVSPSLFGSEKNAAPSNTKATYNVEFGCFCCCRGRLGQVVVVVVVSANFHNRFQRRSEGAARTLRRMLSTRFRKMRKLCRMRLTKQLRCI